jgi:hypothetical protein
MATVHLAHPNILNDGKKLKNEFVCTAGISLDENYLWKKWDRKSKNWIDCDNPPGALEGEIVGVNELSEDLSGYIEEKQNVKDNDESA